MTNKKSPLNFVDKTIAFFSPEAGLKRAQMRARLRKYEGATGGRRGDGWNGSGPNNQNTDIARALPKLRERSIDGYKNNSNVFRAIRTIQNNVVGTGIMPTPKPLPGDRKLTKAETKALKDGWEKFVNECDWDGVFSMYGLQTLAMRNVAMQGEVFIVRQRDASSFVPFKLQVLSSHMCDNNTSMLISTRAADNFVVQGVEFDSRGRKVGYHMFEYDPKNEYSMRLAPKFVPVEDVIQVFYKDFPEQVRGVPFGTPAMLNMRDLADYEDAALMQQKVAASHAMFTTVPLVEGSVPEGFEGEDYDYDKDVDHIEPGMIIRLRPGEEVTSNTTPTPQSFSEYVTKNQQKNAAGFGITYEQYSGDLGNVNFSSGRMGGIEAHKQVEDWQYNMFIFQFCRGVWSWFIQGMRMRGVISRDIDAEWTPPARVYLDPVKEINALILELKSGLISWNEACKQRGYNPDVLLEQMKADRESFKEAGIDVEWVIENVDPSSDPAATDPQEEPSANQKKKKPAQGSK